MERMLTEGRRGEGCVWCLGRSLLARFHVLFSVARFDFANFLQPTQTTRLNNVGMYMRPSMQAAHSSTGRVIGLESISHEQHKTIEKLQCRCRAANSRCGCWTIQYQSESISEVYARQFHVWISCSSGVVFVCLAFPTDGPRNRLFSALCARCASLRIFCLSGRVKYDVENRTK